LVAGATGQVGSAAVRDLLEAGLEVRALVRGAAGYAADPAPLRDVFGVEALAIEEWAGRVSG